MCDQSAIKAHRNRPMKRKLRRAVAVALALCLGWMVAGHTVATGSAAESGDSHAGDHAQNAHETPAHSGGPDLAVEAAARLTPLPTDASWHRPILLAAVCLFIAAAAFGVTRKRIPEAEPPDHGGH